MMTRFRKLYLNEKKNCGLVHLNNIDIIIIIITITIIIIIIFSPLLAF